MRKAKQTTSRPSLLDEDDEFFDAIAGPAPLTEDHPASSDCASYCDHGAAPVGCILCVLEDASLETASATSDTTKRLTPTSSPAPPFAPTPSEASADPVATLFRHNAAAFGCTLCPYRSRQLAELHSHRRSRHRSVRFVDSFYADCSCGTTFASRSAATLHALTCVEKQCEGLASRDSVETTAGNAASGAGASSTTPAPAEPPALFELNHFSETLVSPPPHSTTVGGKRRRLNPLDERSALVSVDDIPARCNLQLTDRPIPPPSACAARRRLATRWGPLRHQPELNSVLLDEVPDTPMDDEWTPVLPSTRKHTASPPCNEVDSVLVSSKSVYPATNSRREHTRWQPRRAVLDTIPDTPVGDRMVVGGASSQLPAAVSGSARAPDLPNVGNTALQTQALPAETSALNASPPAPRTATATCTPQSSTSRPVRPSPRRPARVTWRDLSSVFLQPKNRKDSDNAQSTTGSETSTDNSKHRDPQQNQPASDTSTMDLYADTTATTAMEVDFDATAEANPGATDSEQQPVPRRRRDRKRQSRQGERTRTPTEHEVTARIGIATPTEGEWLLQFDGACRGNPGPGGAGAILLSPERTIIWSCAHYLAGPTTNNVAEYYGLLVGVSSALLHGIRHLRIEGDSTLVLEQVRGQYACRSKKLLRLRRRVRAHLGRLASYSLHHIDRTLNKDADGLANSALDRSMNHTNCTIHPRSDVPECWTPSTVDADVAIGDLSTAITASLPIAEHTEAPDTANMPTEEVVDLARRDGGEVFPSLDLNSGAMPARRPVLRLRDLDITEKEKASKIVEDISSSFAAKISSADNWDMGEGYLTAFTHHIYQALQPFSTQPCGQRRGSSSGGGNNRPNSSQIRLDEAVQTLRAVQRQCGHDRAAVKKARRKVGRIRSAVRRQYARARFRVREKECVEEILRATEEKTATTDPSAPESIPLGQKASSPSSHTRCPISSAVLEEYFTGANTERSQFDAGDPLGRQFRAVLEDLPPATGLEEHLERTISLEEVEQQIHHVSATSAPGLDGVGYGIFKQFLPEVMPALLAAFRFCWSNQRVPRSWKVGVVRLLPKKGDPTKPGNWRPICLQQAIYKLYTGILARRFTGWMERSGRHTDAQKGFRSFNGCADHNYLAAAMTDQAKRQHRALYIVWYDLQNAFGSVSHDMMWFILEKLGVAPPFVRRCKDLYTDAAFIVANASDGSTAPIRQRIGVFQGCPLSPHLFNAVLIPLLRALQKLPDVGVQLSGEDKPSVTAYADDLKVFSGTRAAIARQHDLMQRFLKWSGMRANPNKCSSLGVAPGAHGILQQDKLRLTIHGDAVPTLTMEESYRYLGIGDGVNHERRRVEMRPLLTTVKRQATALFDSGLAPWQVLKAYKIYLLPKLEYGLRFTRPLDSQLESLDDHIRRGFRHLLRLPKQATNEILYAPTSCGGLGLLPLREMHAAIQVAYGWQLLHAKDSQIRRIARAQLGQVVRKRHNVDEHHWREKEDELLQTFLNGELRSHPFAPPKRHHADVESVWSDIQRHVRVYKLKFEDVPSNDTSTRTSPTDVTPQGALNLHVPHFKQWLSHKTVLRHLKLHLKLKHRDLWQQMKTQGRTVRVHGGRGSTLVTNPRGLWDTDYTFVMRARLGVIDTNSALKRWHLRSHGTCRVPGCSHVETLTHVLQHCVGTQDAVRTRHDNVLQNITRELEIRVKESKGRLNLRVNQTVPGFKGPALRPDIQLYDKKTRTAAIVDVAIPFDARDEGDGSGLTWAHDMKIKKYKCVETQLKDRGWKVKSSALVYGALGSVAASNQLAYTDVLGLQKRTAKRLDQKLSALAVQGSRRVWKWHAAQHVRRQRTRRVDMGTGGDPPSQNRRQRSRQN